MKQQYVLTIYQPDGAPPADLDLSGIMSEMGALIDDMKSSGSWVFNAGLYPPDSATVVRMRNGEALITDGPYTEGKEHVGGFLIVQADDLDEALAWARRLAQVVRALPIEVRPIAG